MMLTLTVTACGGQPLAEPLSTSFDVRGGTIGRAQTSQLVLADPERRVSRLQARVECLDGRWRLTQHGANPVIVNGRAVENGEDVALADGDQVQIGTYDMRARIEAASRHDGFDVPAHDCVDPLRVFLDMRAVSSKSLNEPLAQPNTHQSSNPLDSLGQTPQAPPRSMPGFGVGIDSAFPSEPKTQTQTQTQTPPAVDTSLHAAFARGAGMNEADVPDFTPEFAAHLGALLREALQGTVDLLVTRQVIKQMVHARLTLIEPHDNNPLKHAANADAALKSVLGPPMRGYLGGSDALRDACNDLRAHQFGFLAGMRGSISGLFARFAPQQIGLSMPAPSTLQAHSRVLRDAQRWRHYERLYARLVIESEEDFFTLFGKTFLSAYEEAVDQHKR